jgi:hypothetical protein
MANIQALSTFDAVAHDLFRCGTLTDRELSELMNAVNKVLTQRPPKRPTRKAAPNFSPLTEEQRAEMSDSEIHAHYKKRAHVEDVRFAIRHGIVDAMPAELAEAWRELLREAENGLNRTQTHKRLWALCAQWGVLQLERERPKVSGPTFSDWIARARAAGLSPQSGIRCNNWPPSLEVIEQAEKMNAARERRAS